MFGQVLQIFSKTEFYSAVKELKAEKGAKGFTCWGQFVAMLFCQLGHARSLREISGGLASCLGKVKHLGIDAAPSRSTLSYANATRSWRLYEKVFYQLLDTVRTAAPGKKKFRFKNRLFSLDATLIELCVSLFDWATYRTTKGAVKLHLLLDHEGYLPVFANITEGSVHEVNIARTLCFAPGSIVAIDRGYTDYGMFSRWTDDGVYFAARRKGNAVFGIVQEKSVPKHRNILKDQLIEYDGFSSRKKCSGILRRIEVWDDEKKEVMVLLTNHLTFGATTISAIYKDRWQIEIFFKMLKQNLRIKTFVGTSRNALLIQIWTALIAILILKYLKFISLFDWSLSNLIAMLRYNLFTYRDLWEWINKPFEVPAMVPQGEQMTLEFK